MSTPLVLELLSEYRRYVELLTSRHVIVDPADLSRSSNRIDRLEAALAAPNRWPTPEQCSSSEDGHDLVRSYTVSPAEVVRG